MTDPIMAQQWKFKEKQELDYVKVGPLKFWN